MKQRQTRMTSCKSAFVALLVLLVVPALHGPLSHYRPASSGAEDSGKVCLETSESSHSTALSGEACSFCATSARGRSALPAPVVLDPPTPTCLHSRPSDPPRVHGVAIWAFAAPRAPPAIV